MSKKTAAAALLLAIVGAAAAHAQDRPRVMAPVRAEVEPGGFWFGGVERIMRLRDELKLTDAQFGQLEEIRRQHVQRSQEMMELRSRVAAGLTTSEAARAQIEEHNAKFHKDAEETRTRIENILTKEQQDLLDDRYRVYRVQRPLMRELPIRERVRPGTSGPMLRPQAPGMRELRLRERVRPGEIGPMLRLRERAGELRRFDRLDSLPRYYWFGTPSGEPIPGVIRRRGVL